MEKIIVPLGKRENNYSTWKKRKIFLLNTEYSKIDNKLGLRNGKDNSEKLIGILKHAPKFGFKKNIFRLSNNPLLRPPPRNQRRRKTKSTLRKLMLLLKKLLLHR